MNFSDYKFEVGDKVITIFGETGKICGFCTCDRCAERGYFEPMWVRDDGPYTEYTEYISVYQAENGFNNFYRIGKYRFNDFDKDLLTDRITSYEEVLTRLKKQLANIEEIENGEK